MRIRGTSSMLALALASGGCKENAPARSRTVRIAAAADLSKAFAEVGKQFAAKTGITPEITFGASGMLEKQIEQGAPFFLFAAANADLVDRAIASGTCNAATKKIYANGRLVIWTAPGKPSPTRVEELANPAFRKIAIANPEQAPYGRAAKEALGKAGIAEQVKDRLVLGENVLAALAYAKSGNADAAIVSASLVDDAAGGTIVEIDETYFAPLAQTLVVCGSGPEATNAQAFADFVSSPDGRGVMRKFGFVIP